MSTPEYRERRRIYMAELRRRQRGEPMTHEQVCALASEARSRKARLAREAKMNSPEAQERARANVAREEGRQRRPIVAKNVAPVIPAMTHAEYMKLYYDKGKTANWHSNRKHSIALA